MLICEWCGGKTSVLFYCACRLLICQQCKGGSHQEHVQAMMAAKPQPTGTRR